MDKQNDLQAKQIQTNIRVVTLRTVTDQVLNRLMTIWLNANLEAHDFVAPEYWRAAEPAVRKALPGAELTVVMVGDEIAGFAGVQDAYVAGLFVDRTYRNHGLGARIMRVLQTKHAQLTLDVYASNTGAVRFYEQCGFTLTNKTVDADTQQLDDQMTWHA